MLEVCSRADPILVLATHNVRPKYELEVIVWLQAVRKGHNWEPNNDNSDGTPTGTARSASTSQHTPQVVAHNYQQKYYLLMSVRACVLICA